MEKFHLEAGPKTPKVELDPSSGELRFIGKCIPENSIQFFEPIFNWIKVYEISPAPQTKLILQLSYFNTSTSKLLMDLFKRMDAIHQGGRSTANIDWMYDEYDEDMLEAGEDYKSIIKIPFNLITLTK